VADRRDWATAGPGGQRLGARRARRGAALTSGAGSTVSPDSV
jgi:hypothetical protein